MRALPVRRSLATRRELHLAMRLFKRNTRDDRDGGTLSWARESRADGYEESRVAAAVEKQKYKRIVRVIVRVGRDDKKLPNIIGVYLSKRLL